MLCNMLSSVSIIYQIDKMSSTESIMLTRLSGKCGKMFSAMSTITFAEWLVKELEERGWSQADLARETGLTTGGVSNLINQVRKPNPDTCNVIAHALKLPSEIVLQAAGYWKPETSEKPPGFEEWVYIFTTATEQQRQEILDYARYKTGRPAVR
jgi:transcriptional regulator with XRE-family HTH domain